MKKLIYSVFVLAFFACSKGEMQVIPETADSSHQTIIATIDNDLLTKTSYELSGNTYAFSWSEGDKIKIQTTKNTEYNGNTFTAANSAASSSFTGEISSGYSRGAYAFYPKATPVDVFDGQFSMWGGANDLFYFNNEITTLSADDAVSVLTGTVGLKETIIEEAGKPMAHIPMIGYNTSGDYFAFTAPVGILAVTINGLPSAAKYITISSANYALNGSFVFDSNFEIKEAYCKDGSKSTTKTIQFPAASVASRTFYFPIPTGQLNGVTVTIKDMGGQTVYTRSSSQNITISKGVVTHIPALTFSPSVTWYNLGSGNYLDSYLMTSIFYNTKLSATDDYMSDNVSGAVSVGFYQNATSNGVYRINNPYRVAKTARHYYQTQTTGRTVTLVDDDFLYVQVLNAGDNLPYGSLTASDNGEVWFGSGTTQEAVGNGFTKGVFSTGLYIDWGATKGNESSTQYGEYIILHEDWHSNSTQYRKSKVLSSQSNTEFPMSVRLSPYYKTRVENTFSNFSQRNNYDALNSVIEVTFPTR